MRKLYKKYDITNLEAAEVIKRFGPISGDAVIKGEGDKIFILIPEQ